MYVITEGTHTDLKQYLACGKISKAAKSDLIMQLYNNPVNVNYIISLLDLLVPFRFLICNKGQAFIHSLEINNDITLLRRSLKGMSIFEDCENILYESKQCIKCFKFPNVV